jgi:PAS domain S-box-containing protein
MTDKPRVLSTDAGDDVTALSALVDGAQIGLALLDDELRYVRVNAALAEITGAPTDGHVGHQLGTFAAPALRRELHLAARLALGRARAVTGVELEGRTLHRPDAERRWVIDFHPVPRGDGGPPLVAMSAREVTLERQAERQQALIAAVAAAPTVGDVARMLLHHGVPLTGATRGSLSLLQADGRTMRLLDSEDVPEVVAQGWRRFSIDDRLPGPDALRRGATVVAESRADLLRRYPELPEKRLSDGDSFAFVPLHSSSGPIGVLTLIFTERRPFSAEFVSLLESVADQGAVALERAQLYERERRTASVLQQALLPPTLPPIPGLDLAGRFRAGAAGFEIGGDFYDAFPIDAQSWGLVIGDITGKGVDAAALTSLTRYTVRAAAHLEPDPAAVLAALNVAVREGAPGELCTAVFGRLVLHDEHVELTLACGGHPAPIVARGASAAGVRCMGPLIGLDDDLRFGQCTVRLEPGDAVVLYTDGLTDAAAPTVILDEERLSRIVADLSSGDADQIATELVERAVGATPSPRDDIAVLVLKVPERVSGGPAPVTLVSGAR